MSEVRKMLTTEDVLQIVPVSRTTLFRMERDGRMPRSRMVSPNRKVWFGDEINEWQLALKQGRVPRVSPRSKGRKRL